MRGLTLTLALLAPEDLLAERDTLTARAEQLLQDFPQVLVRYDPNKHGWQPPK